MKETVVTKPAMLMVLICFFAFGPLTSAKARACSEDALALRYLNAIETMQWQRMRSFLANDARYTDPTPIPMMSIDGGCQFWLAVRPSNFGDLLTDYDAVEFNTVLGEELSVLFELNSW